MSERIGRKKRKGATLEDLRAAGAKRPRAEVATAEASAEVPSHTAADNFYEVSPKEYADWEHDAAWRQRELSTTEFASVGEALRDFVAQIGKKPLEEAAAEASATLTDNERLSFYDSLAAEEILSVAEVLAMRNGKGDHAPVSTPGYHERGIAVPHAKGIPLTARGDADRERKRKKPFRKLSDKEFERGMERHLSHVPEDAHAEEEFKEANRRVEQSVLPEKQKQSYEDALATLQKELGAPYGIAYGQRFWKRGDGSAIVLESDGHRWEIGVGEPHAFGMHGRVLTRYWTEQGFLDKESASKWLAEKKRLDPKQETSETVSHHPVGDISKIVEEKLKNEAPFTMSAVGRMRPPKHRERSAASAPVAPANLGPEEPRLGATVAEVKTKLGEPEELEGVPYWKRADGTAVIFDAPSSGARKMPLVLRTNGTHRFRGKTKRWTGSEFVDVS